MAMYGSSRPCPPWAIGVRVWPGLTWEASGLAGQDVVRAPDGSVVRVLGITKAPDKPTLDTWSDYVIEACEHGLWLKVGGPPQDRFGLSGVPSSFALTRALPSSTKQATKASST